MREVALLVPLAGVVLAMVWGTLAYGEGELSAYKVRDHGAVGDGATKDTAAVQRAIEACAGTGGTVYFAPGTYLCGSLHLRSNVTLWLDAGATILGSTDNDDYDRYEELGFDNDADRETTYFHYALIWGEDVERVGILGSGTIDSNRRRRGGPKAIALKRCRYVDLKGVTILNCPNYCISMLGTDYVDIDGVTLLEGHCDGIDPDSCRNVRIANCHIETWDDAIVPKASFSLGEVRACENITVTNCYLATGCQNFKLGTESGGDFKRIAVTNCVMDGLEGRRPPIAGIAIESVDGSNIDGVVVSNITMVKVRAPIFIRLGNRGRDMDTPVPGTLRNVTISNVVATGASLTSSITGIPGHDVEGVTLSNIRIRYAGGTAYRPPDKPIPESIPAYPDPRIFEALPAYGLFCRHVNDLTLSNVHLLADDGFWRLMTEDRDVVEWQTKDGVPRPSQQGPLGHALLCDDVTGLNLDGLRATACATGAALLRFVNVRDALVRGCFAPAGTEAFVEALGGETCGISLLANDLRRAKRAVALGKDAPHKAVVVVGSRGE